MDNHPLEWSGSRPLSLTLNSMCEHKKISISECGSWSSQHDREEDGEWTHVHIPGCYNATIIVQCNECGGSWKYSRYHAPKWLRKYLDEIGI